MSEYHHFLSFVAKQHFGPLVQQLISTLLTHGPLTLSAITHCSGLPPSQTRKSLVIAIQHNIVVANYERKATQPPPRATSLASAPSSTTTVDLTALRVLYRVNTAALRCRPRYPAYVTRLRDKMGDNEATIVQVLCMHGILSTQQLMDHATQLHSTSPLTSTSSDPSPATSSPSSVPPPPPQPMEKRRQLDEALERLASGRWVKKAIMAQTNGKVDDEKKVDEDEGEAEYGAGGNTAATDGKKRRRAGDKEEKKEEPKKARGRPAKKKKGTVEEERKDEEESKQQPMDAAISDGGVVLSDHWVLNDAMFTLDTQREAMQRYAHDRIGPTAAFVLSIVLSLSPYESVRPVVVDESTVLTACQAEPKAPKLTASTLHSYLVELTLDASHLLTQRSPTSYSLNMPSFLSHMRLLQTQSILTARYSLLSARLYRLLLLHKRLEETQLAELATASRQDVRSLLHRLVREEWVVVSEVARTVDRAPSKSFFVWGIDEQRVKTRIVDILYTTCVKLGERLAAERAEVGGVMERVEMEQHIDEVERDKVERWRVAQERLQLALREVNEHLALWE